MPDHNDQTKMQALLALGQSVWLDYLSRGLTRSGELQALITDGLRGMTSNPTIFEHAIGETNAYDAALSRGHLLQEQIETCSRRSRSKMSVRRRTFSGRSTIRQMVVTDSSRLRFLPGWLVTATARWPKPAGSGER